jgi:RNase P subunit RPR2
VAFSHSNEGIKMQQLESQVAGTKMGLSTHSISPAKQINQAGNMRIPHPNYHRDINRKQCVRCDIVLIPKRNIPNSSFLNSIYVCTSCQTIRQKARNQIKKLNQKITLANLIKINWANVLMKLTPKGCNGKSFNQVSEKQSHETISKRS